MGTRSAVLRVCQQVDRLSSAACLAFGDTVATRSAIQGIS
jgi:hypothetical protein